MEGQSRIGAFLDHHWIKILIIFNALIIIGLIFYVIVQNQKTASLRIMVAPTSASIIINGHNYENNNLYNFIPGQYTAEISAEGLESKTVILEMTEGKTSNLYTYLVGYNNDFSYYLNKDHYAELSILKQIADTNAQDFLNWYNQVSSISSSLPIVTKKSHRFPDGAYHTDSISILDGRKYPNSSCRTSLCLIVNYYDDGGFEDYHNTALQSISNAGFNPDNYEIIYEENP